ncbi:MAG: WD40 repeat domain-containing protein, partial [Myxococcota bacterium]
MPASYETLPSLPFATRVPRVKQVEVHPSGQLVALVSGTVMHAATLADVPTGLPGRTHDATAVAMAPDGLRLAVATRQRTVVVRDASAAPPRREIEVPAVPVAVRWVDDGRLVVAMAHAGILLLDATTGTVLGTLFESRGRDAFGGLAVARRSGMLVHAQGARLRSIEIDGGRLEWERTLDGEVRAPSVSPDATRVVVTSPVGAEGGPWQRLAPTTGRFPVVDPSQEPPAPRRGLRVLHLADGSDVASGPAFTHAGVRTSGTTLAFTPQPRFSPDGTRIAVNLPTGALAIYDAATLRPDVVVPRDPVVAWIEDLDFAPDGDEVVFGTRHDHIGRFSIPGMTVSASIEGLDPELAGSEAPRPWVAALASFLVPGLG